MLVGGGASWFERRIYILTSSCSHLKLRIDGLVRSVGVGNAGNDCGGRLHAKRGAIDASGPLVGITRATWPEASARSPCTVESVVDNQVSVDTLNGRTQPDQSLVNVSDDIANIMSRVMVDLNWGPRRVHGDIVSW